MAQPTRRVRSRPRVTAVSGAPAGKMNRSIDEAADQAGQRDEPDPADEPRRDERHLIRNAKLPSVRCPSRATTLQKT